MRLLLANFTEDSMLPEAIFIEIMENSTLHGLLKAKDLDPCASSILVKEEATPFSLIANQYFAMIF